MIYCMSLLVNLPSPLSTSRPCSCLRIPHCPPSTLDRLLPSCTYIPTSYALSVQATVTTNGYLLPPFLDFSRKSLTIPTASSPTSSPRRHVYSLTPSLSSISWALCSLRLHSSSFRFTGIYCPACAAGWPVVAPRMVSNVAAVFDRAGGRGGGIEAGASRLRLSMSGSDAECCRVWDPGLGLTEDGVARRRGGGGGGCFPELAPEAEFDDDACEEVLFGVVEPAFILLFPDLEDWLRVVPSRWSDRFCI